MWGAYLAGSPVLGTAIRSIAPPPLFLLLPAACACCAAAACADMPGALAPFAAALPRCAAPALAALAAPAAGPPLAPRPEDFWRLAGGSVLGSGAARAPAEPAAATGREACEDSWLNWLDPSPFTAPQKPGRQAAEMWRNTTASGCRTVIPCWLQGMGRDAAEPVHELLHAGFSHGPKNI